MFFVTLPEKLGIIPLLLKISEKIRSGQDHFDTVDMEELVSPYAFLMPYGHVGKEPVPSSFLSVFDALVDPAYFGKKFEGEPREIPYSIGSIELSKIGINPSKKLSIYSMLISY